MELRTRRGRNEETQVAALLQQARSAARSEQDACKLRREVWRECEMRKRSLELPWRDVVQLLREVVVEHLGEKVAEILRLS